MIVTGLILYGKPNSGKTTTLVELRKQMIDHFTPLGAAISDTRLNKQGDYRTIIKYNNRSLMFLTAGDRASLIEEYYKQREHHRIDIVVAASHSRGDTRKFWRTKIFAIKWVIKKNPIDLEKDNIIKTYLPILTELLS